ncbi:MAG: eukaryotic-like serine/threonine-protein kinase [Acidobacteriota bacterium]|jgi:serine/threonine-protein kinase|nr:eukaryotic-like serine/threonine-protein kinase [Acidobacteriota bacterium]
MDIAQGVRLGRYEILSKLGAGGMGEVYLAQDTQLRRPVALKILPAEFSESKERLRRFEQEAYAVAALNHPNIAHIYEIGEDDGRRFIAMEYIDGETLSEKIHRDHAPLAQLIKYLAQVAEGLAKAHAVGIVHRDLKPENIMVTSDGYAKILDFGLAKLVQSQVGSSDSSESATVLMTERSLPGTVIGTVGYMSPEQAQGRVEEIDHRSDIFSFGCLLYEVATGQKAFQGRNALDSLHKIVYEPTPQIKEINAAAPDDLQEIICKCLAKDAAARYHSIKDVAIELEGMRHELKGVAERERVVRDAASSQTILSGSAPAKSVSTQSGSDAAETGTLHRASSAEYFVGHLKRNRAAFLIGLLLLITIASFVYLHYFQRESAAFDSIAVLPFVNQNRDPESEYLSDGLTESIINSLTELPNLRVIARSSVFRYKGRETDPVAVGKELGVRAVLVGRILQRGDQLTISTELVDVRDNKQLWGEQYERKVSDLLAVQRDIAQEISSSLRTKISGEVQNRVTKHYTENAEAYHLYLKGRYFWNKRTNEGLKKSIEYFNQAIERDPNYALAYAGLADAYVLFPGYSVATPQESYPEAKKAALRALELDDSLAEAHAALGLELFAYEWKAAESSREFKRAIELNPNYATAHHWYGNQNLLYTGKFDEAIAEMKRAQELDPLSLIVNADLGDTYFYSRQYDQAIEQLRKTIEMDQSFYYAHYELGMAYEMKGSLPEAIIEYQKARQLNNDPHVLALLGHAYAASDKREEALRILDQLQEMSNQNYVPAYNFVILYAGLGERDEAFQWLEKSYQDHASRMTILQVDPFLDPLRSDPRFAALVQRVGLQR